MFDNLGTKIKFDNAGSKIKAIAIVFAVIGMIGSAIFGIFVIAEGHEEELIIGVLIIALGCLFSWFSSLLLFGFGQLIENSDILVRLHRSDTLARLQKNNCTSSDGK